MFTIQKDRPIPEAIQRETSRLYPFEEMEVGDSFSITKKDWPDGVESARDLLKRVIRASQEHSRRVHREKFKERAAAGEDTPEPVMKKYVGLVEGEGDEEIVTVWRSQ